LIASMNAVNIDDALEKVSGVQMIDGQANIRGGSGFSYGAGSRVMLLIDDVPALQVDAGYPNWGDVPVENIEQVEVVKGAASALYGSAALNGIINIRTGTPNAIPQTKVSTAYTYYGDPDDPSKKWWGDTVRYNYVLSAVHKQKIGKLDLVLSGFYNKEESYNQATFTNKKRGTAKLKYRLSDKTFINLNAIFNTNRNGDFFLWNYSDSTAYQPFENSASDKFNRRFLIDPSITTQDKFGNIHKILTRYHNIYNDNSGGQSNQSQTLYGEYQIQREIENIDLVVTAGALTSNTNTDAELFGDTTFNTKVFASYLQLEKSFWNRLNLSAGVRYEYNQQNTPEEFNGTEIPNGRIEDDHVITRFGASYEYMPYSSIRASWGQGYRFPTITERFITTTFGIFAINANPDLVPETGWSAEIGIKQGFQFKGIKGFIDVAGFTSRYQDMMEFTFGFANFRPSFTSQNIGDTEIRGAEISLFASMDIGETKISALGGYTYIDPKYTNFENEDLQYSLSEEVNVLKYRSRQNAKMDIQADYRNFSLGIATTYASHMINIDAVLEGKELAFGSDFDIIGLEAYRNENNKGYNRWDARIAYKWNAAKFSFLVNNIFNLEYSVRPALLEAPRNYTLRFDYLFNWEK